MAVILDAEHVVKPLPDDILRAMSTTTAALVERKRAESAEILSLVDSYVRSGMAITVVPRGVSGMPSMAVEPKRTREEVRKAVAEADWARTQKDKARRRRRKSS